MPTKTTLLVGSGLLSCGWIAIEPTASVGWLSMTGVHVILAGFWLSEPALVDFHTPPYAPPMYTVLPVESAGSIATEVALPDTNP